MADKRAVLAGLGALALIALGGSKKAKARESGGEAGSSGVKTGGSGSGGGGAPGGGKQGNPSGPKSGYGGTDDDARANAKRLGLPDGWLAWGDGVPPDVSDWKGDELFISDDCKLVIAGPDFWPSRMREVALAAANSWNVGDQVTRPLDAYYFAKGVLGVSLLVSGGGYLPSLTTPDSYPSCVSEDPALRIDSHYGYLKTPQQAISFANAYKAYRSANPGAAGFVEWLVEHKILNDAAIVQTLWNQTVGDYDILLGSVRDGWYAEATVDRIRAQNPGIASRIRPVSKEDFFSMLPSTREGWGRANGKSYIPDDAQVMLAGRPNAQAQMVLGALKDEGLGYESLTDTDEMLAIVDSRLIPWVLGLASKV